jgi:hypothetical protein
MIFKTRKKGDPVDLSKKTYKEVGANYLHFLRWGYAVFTGQIAVLSGISIACWKLYSNNLQFLINPILVFASPVGENVTSVSCISLPFIFQKFFFTAS